MTTQEQERCCLLISKSVGAVAKAVGRNCDKMNLYFTHRLRAVLDEIEADAHESAQVGDYEKTKVFVERWLKAHDWAMTKAKI